VFAHIAVPLVAILVVVLDPDEFDNLAGSPDYADVLEDMLFRLSEWMHETFDYLPPAFSRPGEAKGRGWPITL
jgi:hypothetical protein